MTYEVLTKYMVSSLMCLFFFVLSSCYSQSHATEVEDDYHKSLSPPAREMSSAVERLKLYKSDPILARCLLECMKNSSRLHRGTCWTASTTFLEAVKAHHKEVRLPQQAFGIEAPPFRIVDFYKVPGMCRSFEEGCPKIFLEEKPCDAPEKWKRPAGNRSDSWERSEERGRERFWWSDGYAP